MKKPLLALALILPAPTIGVFAAMVAFPDSKLGVSVFFACKVWMFALPLLWHVGVERLDLASLRPAGRGLAAGAGLGVLIGAAIVLAYYAGGRLLLSTDAIAAQLNKIGFVSRIAYVGFALYWILVNSLIEEYVWRWFVTQQFARLIRPGLAIVLSGICFAIHHIVALQTLFAPAALAVASFAIFIGGVAWSGCFVRYRSIWPGYVSHAIVDLAVFAIGYTLLF